MARPQKNSLIFRRLESVASASDLIQTNTAKEIVQEIALLGLARSGFFKVAAFHGGTCFRIIDGLDRFSEDLDFALLEPIPSYSITELMEPLQSEMASWGLDTEVVDRSKAENVIKKAFLKERSLGKVLSLRNPLNPSQKLHIKIELDINPPKAARTRNALCEFPTDFYVRCHDQGTMFAGKLHAMLRRQYSKGRDWYDFTKYIALKAPVNFLFLKNALDQNSEEELPSELGISFLREKLTTKISTLDISTLVIDVRPFLESAEQLDLWSHEYFLIKLEKMVEYLS
jgi:predicted nucleotidyltransferase component of viral defense system